MERPCCLYLWICGVLELPYICCNLTKHHHKSEAGPSQAAFKYSQGSRQSNMNFNELLSRIIYLLPQHPAPPIQ